MKELGYKIFAILYRIFCMLPLKKKQIFLVMTHDAGPEGNVAVLRDYIGGLNKGYRFYELKRLDTYFGHSLRKMWHFFVVDSYRLARSSYVFLDNMFLPMAYIHFRSKVKVVQLWHGTGVIKKIGADANTGHLKELEYLANQNNTHLIVSSKTTKRIYQKSFSMGEAKVHITGMPRSDVFFQKERQQTQLQQFYKEYPQLKGKRLVLYAPTFRDWQVENPKLAMDVEAFAGKLPEDVVLGLRLHPFVARNYHLSSDEKTVVDFSSYKSLNTLLFATTLLISDYSSIVFEYAALKRPLIFFAYDLKKFEETGRGFYWDYESYVPGPVVREEDALLQQIRTLLDMPFTEYDERYHLSQFIEDTYQYTDGRSVERIVQLLEL